MLLWAEAGHQLGCLQATPPYPILASQHSWQTMDTILGARVPPLILDANAGLRSNLQANALQQLMQSLGLGPLALALSAAGASRPHSLLRQHIHVDELERAQPAIE